MLFRPDGDDDENPNIDVMKEHVELKLSNSLKNTKPTLENHLQNEEKNHIKSERIASRFLF